MKVGITDVSLSSPSPPDTPRPVQRRGLSSSRFPVIPSTGGDSGSEMRSPGFQRPPPIPSKSHFRVPSTQSTAAQKAALRRPGIAPHINGSERIRSNSESILQQGTVMRNNKRLGVLQRKNGLGTLGEEPTSMRHSHYRGASDGSAMRNGVINGDTGILSPRSPGGRKRPRAGFVQRLSSLPEHKRVSVRENPVLKGVKGVLYALHVVHPHISTLINVVKANNARQEESESEGDTTDPPAGRRDKRNSLELVLNDAGTHLDRLNEDLTVYHASRANWTPDMSQKLKAGCQNCTTAYCQALAQLRSNIPKLVANADARYVRTLMMMVCNSIIEARNACTYFERDLSTAGEEKKRIFKANGQPQVRGQARPPMIHHPTAIHHPATSTPNLPKLRPQPMNRMRSDTAFQHVDKQQIPFSQTTVPLYTTARSRSNSRTNTLTNSSVPSSFSNTPRSGESFASLGTPMSAVSGYTNNSTLRTLNTEPQEEMLFERIFHQLSEACDMSLRVVPMLQNHATHWRERVRHPNPPSSDMSILFNNIRLRCIACVHSSDALKSRLSGMNVSQLSALRLQRDFWALCQTFLSSFFELIQEMRHAKSNEVCPRNIREALRPIKDLLQISSKLVKASPWGALVGMDPMQIMTVSAPVSVADPIPPTPTTSHHHVDSGYQSTGSVSYAQSQPYIDTGTIRHHHPTASELSFTANHAMALPPTPLSAALGPAAQATVPTTPASAYSNSFFDGDVFQRADSLLMTGPPGYYTSRRERV